MGFERRCPEGFSFSLAASRSSPESIQAASNLPLCTASEDWNVDWNVDWSLEWNVLVD